MSVEREGGSLNLFRCERRSCSLSVTSCAASWQAAQRKRPEPWEGLWHCRSCPVGAASAGKPMPVATVTGDALSCICPRCQRSAARIIKGRLCVSCYNREREVIKGRNAKGTIPRLTAKLHRQVLAVNDGNAVRVEVFDRVASRVEAMLAIARTSTGSVAFGRPALLLEARA
ncbi:hypothetical protein [Azospirillum sp.]|uniref:hypothetical protein n=1 Tax=Azospirillum sp. TaxID=34012 RepID=UPI002D3ADB2C|nr:hypothetical protein [Azospirillum sp.]HYD68502.1 hypothetical protein [Azospirillum sp.]